MLEAKTPKPTLKIEGEDVRVDARYQCHNPTACPDLVALTKRNRMLKDDRIREERQRSIFDVKDAADRLG